MLRLTCCFKIRWNIVMPGSVTLLRGGSPASGIPSPETLLLLLSLLPLSALFHCRTAAWTLVIFWYCFSASKPLPFSATVGLKPQDMAPGAVLYPHIWYVFLTLWGTPSKWLKKPRKVLPKAFSGRMPHRTPSKNRHLPGIDALWHPRKIFHRLAGEAESLREIANHFRQLIRTQNSKRIFKFFLD